MTRARLAAALLLWCPAFLSTEAVPAKVEAGPVAAQAPPAFDVVSVKESPPIGSGPVMIRPGSPDPSGNWSARNATLQMLLQGAFPDFNKPGLIVDAPAWIDQRRFDIDARSEVRPDRSQYPALVQRLLADRFGLKTHVEKRPVDVYWLVIARSDGRLGKGLHPATEQCLAELEAERQRNAQRTGPFTVSSADIGACGRHTTIGASLHMIGAQPVDSLARSLQIYANQQVVDHTGLTGVYQWDLEFDYNATRSIGTAAAAAPTGPTVFTAVQEQLGLKLERHRDPMDVLVIDSISQPTAN